MLSWKQTVAGVSSVTLCLSSPIACSMMLMLVT